MATLLERGHVGEESFSLPPLMSPELLLLSPDEAGIGQECIKLGRLYEAPPCLLTGSSVSWAKTLGCNNGCMHTHAHAYMYEHTCSRDKPP